MKVTLVATGPSEDCGIAEYTTALEKSLHCDTERLSLRLGSLNLVHYLLAALRLLRTNSDVIHVQHEYGIYGPKSIASWLFFPILWTVSLIKKVPIVITFHTAWGEKSISPPLQRLKIVYVLLNNKMVAAVADKSLFLSDETRDLFATSATLVDAEVLPHGVQTDVIPMSQREAKSKLDVDTSRKVIAEPGYIRPEKGSDFMIQIAEAMTDHTVALCGGIQSDSNADFLESIRKNAPQNLEITGVLDDPEFHAMFNAIDVAVLPYERMSQSGIVNWCVAYDVPIVASNLPRFKELERDYGIVKTFVKGDLSDAVEQIQMLLEEESPMQAQMESYRRSRSMDEVATKHLEVYENVDNQS